MAIDCSSSGTQTTKLFFKSGITNLQYSNGFNITGSLNIGVIPSLYEDDYIDIGIITDEREELALGGYGWSAPGSSASQRVYWSISGKVLRVTISGIIPDGIYTSIGVESPNADTYNGMSNSSVFRTKMNKIIGYLSVYEKTAKVLTPASVYYRRKGIYEYTSQIPQWVLTNFSSSYIEGTRNMRYSLSLEFSNNDTLISTAASSTGIRAREFGDIQ